MNAENKNQINTKNNIIPLLEIFEKIFDNDILKYKYIFFDFLLNEWYKINKALFTDKLNDLENINSLLIYNCHKYLIYTLIKIADKYSIKIFFNFFNYYNKKIMQKKLIIIKRIFFDDLKNKIKEENILKTELNEVKYLFMYYLMNNNIQILSKENLIKKKHLMNKFNNDNKIYSNIDLNICFIKWELYKNEFINIGDVVPFYLDKIKFFQGIAFIYIYKRKLRHIYNLFINKIGNGKDIYFIKKNKIKNQNLLLSLLNPINKNIKDQKMNFLERLSSYFYFRKKITYFIHIISFFINNIIYTYKKQFINNLKIYINKRKNNTYLFFLILQNFISLKKAKIKIFFFSSIKSKLNNNNNKYNYTKTNSQLLSNNNNQKILINLINIYHKYHKFRNWKLKQNFKISFNKWKSNTKLDQYNELSQNNKILKKKFENYNTQNIIMKNKLKIIKNKTNKKKKINSNIKEKIKNNIKKNEKIIISEDITYVINNNKKELNNTNNNLKINYLNSLEDLKNKNEPIIYDLQIQINNLVKEIELLSSDL